MDSLDRLKNLSVDRDKGRISALLVAGVGFLAWYGIGHFDDSRGDSEPTPITMPSVDATTPLGALDGQITVSTLSVEDQAILDAIDAHHASSSLPASAESAAPDSTHETHEPDSSAVTSAVVDTTHPHVAEQPAEPAVVTQTATTIAHSSHSPAPTAAPSAPVGPNTTHEANHTPVATATTQPTSAPETTHGTDHTPPVTQPETSPAPVTINSTVPPQAPLTAPGG